MPAAPLEPHSYLVPGDALRTDTTPVRRYLAGLCVLLEHGHLFELPEHPKRAAADRFAASLATLRDWLTAEERADVADFEETVDAIRSAVNLGASPLHLRIRRGIARRWKFTGNPGDEVVLEDILRELAASTCAGATLSMVRDNVQDAGGKVLDRVVLGMRCRVAAAPPPSEEEVQLQAIRDLVRRNYDESGILADRVPVSRIVDLLHAASARGGLTFADHEVRGLVLRAFPAVECDGDHFLGFRPVPS